MKRISEKCFELNGLHLYYDTPVSSLIKLKSYSFILIDCGCVSKRDAVTGEITLIHADTKNALEIERADIKICVCQIKPWQIDETLFLINSELSLEGSGDCRFYFTMTDTGTFLDAKRKFSGKNLFNAPYHPAIFGDNAERDIVFGEMLSWLINT